MNHTTGLHFLDFLKSQEEDFNFLKAFFVEYEYLNQFFPANTDLPRFYVKGLKITLNGYF